MEYEALNTIANLVRVLILPLVGYVAWVVRDIRQQLHIINGRVGRMEQWSVDHERSDDSRFSQVLPMYRDR